MVMQEGSWLCRRGHGLGLGGEDQPYFCLQLYDLIRQGVGLGLGLGVL